MPPGYAADSGYPLTRVEILEMERCKKGVTIGQPVFELGKCSVLLEVALALGAKTIAGSAAISLQYSRAARTVGTMQRMRTNVPMRSWVIEVASAVLHCV